MRPLDLCYLDNLLKPLRAGQLTVFSAACATRILPVYYWVHKRIQNGNPVLLQVSLDDVWRSCMGHYVESLIFEKELCDLEELAPKKIDQARLLEYAAQSIGAVTCAVRAFLFEDFQDATWAAQCVQECIGHHLRSTHEFKNRQGQSLIEELSSYEVMRNECSRQERDAIELSRIPIENIPLVANLYKSRAMEECALPELSKELA